MLSLSPMLFPSSVVRTVAYGFDVLSEAFEFGAGSDDDHVRVFEMWTKAM